MYSKPAITIDTAAMLMQLSKRTLWRHLSEGKLSQQPKDSEGRAMILIEEIAGQLAIRLLPPAQPANQPASADEDEYVLLAEADRGNSDAQNDLALLCLEQGQHAFALHYFQRAAEQNHADAMHYLSSLYEQGLGVPPCSDTALVWLTKAAACGHAIARAQLAAF